MRERELKFAPGPSFGLPQLSDESLGLVVKGKGGTTVRVAPERSTHVFVDETGWGRPPARAEERIDALEWKLDRVLSELEALRNERGR